MLDFTFCNLVSLFEGHWWFDPLIYPSPAALLFLFSVVCQRHLMFIFFYTTQNGNVHETYPYPQGSYAQKNK